VVTPSIAPSGMGVHMTDLAAGLIGDTDVSVMCWETAAGRDLLARAADVRAEAVPLTRPRDARFAEVIVSFLEADPPDIFRVHVGTGRENFDGARAARRAGVLAVIQTQHLPWLLSGWRARTALRGAGAGRSRHHGLAGAAAHLRTRRGAGGEDDDRPQRHPAARPGTGEGRRASGTRNPSGRTVGADHRSSGRHEGALLPLHLAGHRSDARMLLDAADVFVLPSRHEGMPLALLEAMDTGLPVVATRVIGSEEVVVYGETGFLVPSEDSAAIAAAVGCLLGDREMRLRFGAAGRRRFRDHFTFDRMAAATAAVYERVLTDVRSAV
jgi:hypothetical protein